MCMDVLAPPPPIINSLTLPFLRFRGTQVKIMLPWDPAGKIGPKKPLPDHVSIVEPKEGTLPPNPFSETKAVKPDQAPVV